jgi:hypothetical protein
MLPSRKFGDGVPDRKWAMLFGHMPSQIAHPAIVGGETSHRARVRGGF